MAKTRNIETSQSEAIDEPEQNAVIELRPDANMAELIAEIATLKGRLARVEQAAHTEHATSKESMDQITAHVMGHVREHIRKTIGHSGLPVRGDET